MSSKQLNLGIIGAGRIGSLHAQNLAFRIPQANVRMMADINEIAAQQVAERCRIPSVVNDYHALLENRDLQAVLICSATHTHAQIIEEAAHMGKHIFCEKPIDLTLAKIDGALVAVSQAGVQLQVGFNRRFDANFARVRRAIAEGEIGEPHLLHIISRDPAPPPIEYVRVSGGIFLDMTIHDFDMARFLAGDEVEEVYVAAAVRVDPAIGAAGDLDTAVTVLKFKGGLIGTIDNSRKAVYGYDQRVEVLGNKGSIRTDNNYPNSGVISDAQTIHHDKPLYFFLERYNESFVNELTVFVDAVLNDKSVPVTGADGRAPVVMGLAARKSYDENRPVKLSEIG